MEQKDVLRLLNNEKIEKYLNELSEIHKYTKHYLLIAEEISEEGVAFLQPMKEHRDAYDHLIRIFSLPIKELNEKFNPEEYVLDNVKKAFGHEYRAFFDMADWFTYICRKYIREELTYSSVRKRYEEKYKDFDEVRKFINQVPFDVAKYREDKDVSNDEQLLSEVLSYKEIMDKLLKIYKNVKLL